MNDTKDDDINRTIAALYKYGNSPAYEPAAELKLYKLHRMSMLRVHHPYWTEFRRFERKMKKGMAAYMQAGGVPLDAADPSATLLADFERRWNLCIVPVLRHGELDVVVLDEYYPVLPVRFEEFFSDSAEISINAPKVSQQNQRFVIIDSRMPHSVLHDFVDRLVRETPDEKMYQFKLHKDHRWKEDMLLVKNAPNTKDDYTFFVANAYPEMFNMYGGKKTWDDNKEFLGLTKPESENLLIPSPSEWDAMASEDGYVGKSTLSNKIRNLKSRWQQLLPLITPVE